MDNERRSPIGELLNLLGKFIAVIMIVRYALIIVHSYYNFLPAEGIIADILSYIGIYGPLVLVSVVALGAVWDKSDILKLVMLIICAAIIIFHFFPSVLASIEQFAGISKVS